MRHSLEVARGSYRKIDAIPNSLKIPNPHVEYPSIKPLALPMEIPILAPRPEIPVLIAEPKKLFDLKKWEKDYRTEHAEELAAKRKAKYAESKHDILKQKILWHLNNAVVTRPNQNSITVYKLYQDPESGQWKSREDDREEQ